MNPSITPQPAPTTRPSDAQYTARVIADLAATASTPIENGDSIHILAPVGFVLHDISVAVEKMRDRPCRVKGDVRLSSLDSLLTIVKEQAEATKELEFATSANGYIYADPDSRTITAVFNDQKNGMPGWRDHRASFTAEFTPEFSRWRERNGSNRAMTQGEFAEFIEDNIADIPEPGAQQLLEVATTIQAKTNIAFSSAKRLQDGQTQLGYTETIDATAGVNGALSIPKGFELGLRIFKNGEGYKLKARLKYRLGGGTDEILVRN